MAKAAKKVEMNAEDKVLEIITKTLDENKAEDVVVIDLRGKTSIANQWWLPAARRSAMWRRWPKRFRKILRLPDLNRRLKARKRRIGFS